MAKVSVVILPIIVWITCLRQLAAYLSRLIQDVELIIIDDN